MDVDSVEIEELDKSEIPESELTQFEETEPIRYERVASQSQQQQHHQQHLNDEEEEILLKKFINGEVDFPEYYTRLASDEEDDVEDDVDVATTSEYKRPGDNPEAAEISSTSFQVELLASCRQSLRGNFQGPSSVRPGRKRVMSSVLQSLMGQANLCFARGQNDLAEKLCLEIIRQDPLVPGPYQTLAQIYETKDPTKWLQFSTIAAHLSTNDRDQWMRLAEVYIDRKNYAQARSCLSNGIKYCPKDYELRLRKAQLFEMMSDRKSAISCYYRLLQILPLEKGDLCLEVAKKVAKFFHTTKRYKDAMIAMRDAYKLVPQLFTTEDLNLFLELLILNEEFRVALKVLTDHSLVDIVIEYDGDDILIVSCDIPDDLVPEFRVKFVIILIHLKAYHMLEYVLNNISVWIPPETGIDFYVDITEELIKEHRYSEVVNFLQPLVHSTSFTTPPYVWLCYADCERVLNNTDKAIAAYYTVVQSAPNCFDARLTLSALLKQQGRSQEAIKVLEQDAEWGPIEPRLLYERCLMHKSVGDMEQYLNVGYLMLLRNSLKFRTRGELYQAALTGSRCRREFVKNVKQTRREIDEVEDDGPEYIQSDGNLSVEDEYTFYKDLMEAAYKLKKFGLMEKFAFTALISTRFRTKYPELEASILCSSLYNNDAQVAFEYLRTQLLKNLEHNAYWNMFSLILQKGDDIRYRRFIDRLQGRMDPALSRIFQANYFMFSGSFKYALNEFMPLMKKTTDPLIPLCISVTLNQISGQKNITKRATAQTHATAFMRKYSDWRTSPHTIQEVYYNLGRLYHSAGLLHIALNYYEKALAAQETDLIQEHGDVLSLTREIAFNLHLIYKASGNYMMARKIIKDHIVV